MSTPPTRSGPQGTERRAIEAVIGHTPAATPPACALAVSLRTARLRGDGVRLWVPTRTGGAGQLLCGQLLVPDLGRARQLQGRSLRSGVPPVDPRQHEAASVGPDHARARPRDRA